MNKVKRKRINWICVLKKVGTQEMFSYFVGLQCRFKKHKHCSSALSPNRCAYATLKHFYSTTTIGELLEKVGL